MPSTVGETWLADARTEWGVLKRSGESYRAADDYILRYIDVHDCRDIESKVQALKGQTITTLVVNGETVAGSWVVYDAGYEPLNSSNPSSVRIWQALVPSTYSPSNALVDVTGKYYTEASLFKDETGATKKRTLKYWYDVKRDWGVSSGYTAYNGACSGSNFELLGNNWYHYRKVYHIQMAETETNVAPSTWTTLEGEAHA